MTRFLTVLLLFGCLFVAGCADSGSSNADSNNNNSDNRFGGFYGGMNGGGGMAH